MEAFTKNRLGELFERSPFMILNDEGHHAYRPKPMTEEEAHKADAEAKKDREEATMKTGGTNRPCR